MKGHRIEVLVAYGKFEVLEGSPIEGMVIARFPDVKSARDWYNSEAYQSVASTGKKGRFTKALLLKAWLTKFEMEFLLALQRN